MLRDFLTTCWHIVDGERSLVIHSPRSLIALVEGIRESGSEGSKYREIVVGLLVKGRVRDLEGLTINPCSASHR